jgi:hypothetical protein
MQELLRPTAALVSRGLSGKVALVADGRFSETRSSGGPPSSSGSIRSEATSAASPTGWTASSPLKNPDRGRCGHSARDQGAETPLYRCTASFRNAEIGSKGRAWRPKGFSTGC